MDLLDFYVLEKGQDTKNIPFRVLEKESTNIFVSVDSMALINTVRYFKTKYKVYNLSTIVVCDRKEKFDLKYIFLIDLEEGSRRLILEISISKNTPIIDSIVHEIPGAFYYEREVFETMGIKFKGHPNLKRMFTPDILPDDIYPLRKSSSVQEIKKKLNKSRKKEERKENKQVSEQNDLEGCISEKSDYSISVGPQHPSLEEPIRFVFHIEGETVKNVDVRLGFNHRGIEKAFESRTWIQNLYLAERICGICSNAHQLCYVQAVEDCAGISNMISERAKYIRVILAELERIHSHLLWYGILAHNAGFDTIFHYTWRDREIIMDILEEISGNRVNYAMHTIGGVRRDINVIQAQKIIGKLNILRKKILKHQDLMLREKSLISRLKDIAVLSKKDAKRLCVVGPNARASGINQDFRKDYPYAAYDQFSFDIPTTTEGDILDGLIVRLKESLFP